MIIINLAFFYIDATGELKWPPLAAPLDNLYLVKVLRSGGRTWRVRGGREKSGIQIGLIFYPGSFFLHSLNSLISFRTTSTFFLFNFVFIFNPLRFFGGQIEWVVRLPNLSKYRKRRGSWGKNRLKEEELVNFQSWRRMVIYSSHDSPGNCFVLR